MNVCGYLVSTNFAEEQNKIDTTSDHKSQVVPSSNTDVSSEILSFI